MKAAQASLRRGSSPDLSTLEIWDQQLPPVRAHHGHSRIYRIAPGRAAARFYDDVADSL